MASLFRPSSSLWSLKKNPTSIPSPLSKHPFLNNTHFSFPLSSKSNSRKSIKFSANDQEENESSSSSSSSSFSVISERPSTEYSEKMSEVTELSEKKELEERSKQQEWGGWKIEEEFKIFLGNPMTEDIIELEKKLADRILKEFDTETNGNPIVGFFNRAVEGLKAEESFKALDINKLKNCFGYDTFFVTDVRRFENGGMFVGNLRKPIEEVMPKLEKKLSEAAGRDVVLWLMEEEANDITKQVCMVQPKSEIDLLFETTKPGVPWFYASAIALCITTFGTIAFVSGFFLKPEARFDDYLADVVPLFGAYLPFWESRRSAQG